MCYLGGVGHVYQRVKLSAVNEEERTILVDTGATYSMIPPALADRLGAPRLPGTVAVTLADGRQIDAEFGIIKIDIQGRTAGTTVIIADCPEPLIGVETLEALGLAVDPTTGTLKPTRAYTIRLGGAWTTALA